MTSFPNNDSITIYVKHNGNVNTFVIGGIFFYRKVANFALAIIKESESLKCEEVIGAPGNFEFQLLVTKIKIAKQIGDGNFNVLSGIATLAFITIIIMASFIELTNAKHANKILLNLEEVTFFHEIETKKGKATHIHLTSSTYAEDRTIKVTESYDTMKGYVNKAKLMLS